VSRHLPFDLPRQQLIDTIDRMLGDAADHLTQVGLGVEAVEFARADQAVDCRRTLASRVRARNEEILPIMPTFA
jgi:hypothetical protein